MKKRFIISWAIMALFVIFSIIGKNYEFLYYSVALAGLTYLLFALDKKYKFPAIGIYGYNLWLALHLAGGLVKVGNTVLYGAMILPLVGEPYNILRFDQILHTFCYIVMGLLMYSIVKDASSKKASKITIITITVLAAIGIGAMNELLEFMMVVFLKETGVGGYYNTALDIVANFIGALAAGIYLWFREK